MYKDILKKSMTKELGREPTDKEVKQRIREARPSGLSDCTKKYKDH